MDTCQLYGLGNCNHDFNKHKSWGKNIFTNAFPVALLQYLAIERGFDPVLLEASDAEDDAPTRHRIVSWKRMIGTDPRTLGFLFEQQYDHFRRYCKTAINNSDVVVTDQTGAHIIPLEIKLTAVPDSTTLRLPRHAQAPEIVARPLMVEQLALSICQSFGEARRAEINEIIVGTLQSPQQFRWSDPDFMMAKLPAIDEVVEEIILHRLENQLPMVLNAIWRTQGDTPLLEDECFDIFFWTNMAVLRLFQSSSRCGEPTRISRPKRSLIWLVKNLYDYSAQGHLSNIDTTALSYGSQTDKAGASSGRTTAPFLASEYLTHPRIKASELSQIIKEIGYQSLSPERRLDAAIWISQHIK